MKQAASILKKSSPIILTLCFVLYTIIQWVLLLRDGRAMYAIAHFYPTVLPLIKILEPNLVRYGINSIPTILFAIVTLFAFASYFFALTQKFSIKKIVLFSLLFQAITFFAYPSLATDIFSYILSDRIMTVYHQNVWFTKPIAYASDPFYSLADWQFQTRVYGGVNQFFYNFASVLGANDLLRTVVLYKLLVWLFTLGTMFVVYLTAKKYYPDKVTFALTLIFWNPLFVLETLGSGHNDILMIFFMLLSFYFFKEKKVLFSSIALVLGIQVKLVAVLLVPFLIVYLFSQKKFIDIILFSLGFFITNAVVFYFMQIDPITFAQKVSFNLGVYWQSLPNIIHRFYPNEKIFFTTGLLIMFVSLLFYQWRRKKDALEIYCLTVLLYLFFFATAYWNWYVLWALVFIPFIDSQALRRATLVFSFTSLFAYPLFWLALRVNHEFIGWHIFRYVMLSIIPFLYLLYYRYKEKLT